MTVHGLRRVLARAFRRALESVDLEERVRETMPRVPATVRRGAIVAVGKAAPAMARGALAVVDDRFTRVLVVAPDGTEARLRDPRVLVLRAAHPDPDERSVKAARQALGVVADADFVIALVSGGASSLLCLPVDGHLPAYVRAAHAVLTGGADVRALNVLRRHACLAKGGGLTRAAGGPVRTLIASDVLHGEAFDVGSGPTVPDPTTRAEARRVLSRYAKGVKAPALHESLKPREAAAKRSRARFVARPDDLARELAEELRGKLKHVRVLRPTTEPVESVAREYAERARSLARGEAVVRAAEPSLAVVARRPGRGGRSTHLGAMVAPELGEGVVLLAAASDGVDGASETGGALVDGSLEGRVGRESLERALARFDTGSVLVAAGMALPSGPTGTNLADVHVLARV
jgi:hydroxypyruvate reductase